MSDGTNLWAVATLWMALAALSAILALRLKIAAALIEIVAGLAAANAIGLQTNAWVDFLAGLGSVLLTFLAGAEIEPGFIRRRWLPSALIGLAAFAAPCAAVGLYAAFVLHWPPEAVRIAALALSTTSIAVVYAVIVEAGLATREVGQLMLAACFFTNLGTVVGLGALFVTPGVPLLVALAATALAALVLPHVAGALAGRAGKYLSDPALRMLLAALFGVAWLATRAQFEGVLPAYFVGLGCAGLLLRRPEIKRRLQSMTMAFFAPFYFLKAGTFVSLAAALASAGSVVALFLISVIAKIGVVYPLARMRRYSAAETNFVTLLMATGLTFGAIVSLFGLTRGYVDRAQYSILMTVVLLTALVPTVIAQWLFKPAEEPEVFESEVP